MSQLPKRPSEKMVRVPFEEIVAASEEPACYILITCGSPSKGGKMQVEMTYDGDPTLAAFLLEQAQGLLERE